MASCASAVTSSYFCAQFWESWRLYSFSVFHHSEWANLAESAARVSEVVRLHWLAAPRRVVGIRGTATIRGTSLNSGSSSHPLLCPSPLATGFMLFTPGVTTMSVSMAVVPLIGLAGGVFIWPHRGIGGRFHSTGLVVELGWGEAIKHACLLWGFCTEVWEDEEHSFIY